MPNIECEWMLCKHNTSITPEVSGACLYEGTVQLVHVDNDDVDSDDPSFVEGLTCKQMERRRIKEFKK